MVEQPAPAAETAAELAARFHRSDASVRNWLAAPGAPEPTGQVERRGKLARVYDPDTVEAYFRATGRLPASPEPAPGEDPLMTLTEAAAHAGLQWKTASSYVARKQWPGPDVPAEKSEDGHARWRRSTIDRARTARRRMS